MATRRVTFRLYPKPAQEKQLHNWRKLHQQLYNACLHERKVQYLQSGKSISYFEQQNLLPAFKECWPEYKALGSHALQATVKRVDFAYQRFFTGLGGKPKFKAFRHYRGWTYPCSAGWKATTNGENGYLILSNLGAIQMRSKARTWGTPKTCTIMFKDDKWYASITVDCEPVRVTDTGTLGIDFGVNHAIACSDGTLIDNPRYLIKARAKVKAASRKLRKKRAPNFKRKVKGSRGWKKARKAVSKLQNKVTRQRADWSHKVAAQLVSGNSYVATEKLNIKAMTRKAKKGSKQKAQKTGLNRSLLDVGISNLVSLLKYKLSECEGVFVEVPIKIAASQTCPSCGAKKKKELSERVHNCSCGCVLNRDVAAAKVMLNYALGLGTSLISCGVASSTSKPAVKCGGWKQEAMVKQPKPPSQPQADGV